MTGKLRQIIDQLEIENEYFYQKNSQIRNSFISKYFKERKCSDPLIMYTYVRLRLSIESHKN